MRVNKQSASVVRGRIKELDGLRGVAAAVVVVYHYFYRYDKLYQHQEIHTELFYYGKLGVELFFMISGYVIFWSLMKIQRPRDFLVFRFARLYPVYWASVLLTFLIVSIFGLPGREASFSTFIANLLMFHEYFGFNDVDGVYWTLKVELTFYLWIFILFSLRLLKRIDLFISLQLILSLLVHTHLVTLPELVYDLLFLRWIPFFAMGISLFKLQNDLSNKHTIINLVGALLITIVAFSLKSFLVFSGFLFVFVLAVRGRFKLLGSRYLVFLGTLSYALYLIHQNIGYVIIRKGYAIGLHPMLSIGIAMLIVLFLSWTLHRFVELPGLRLIKNTYIRRQSAIREKK